VLVRLGGPARGAEGIDQASALSDYKDRAFGSAFGLRIKGGAHGNARGMLLYDLEAAEAARRASASGSESAGAPGD